MPAPGPWFYPKRYGYGAAPAGWQGWAATGLFIMVATTEVLLVPGLARWVGLAALVAIFIAIVRRHTEGRWRWRWGDR